MCDEWIEGVALSMGGGEVTRAKEIFTNVAIGLVIILVAWLVVNALMATLTTIAQWSNLC